MDFSIFERNIINQGSDFNDLKVSFSIDVKSIDTNQAQRDAHLQSGDFFEVAIYPNVSFESSFEKK